MEIKSLSWRLKKFLRKEYHGDGKYFIYLNKTTKTKTAIYDLQELEDGLVEILGEGNKSNIHYKTGKYLIVKFTKKFHDMFGEELEKVWGSLYSKVPD